MLNLDTPVAPIRPVIRYHCAFCSWVGTLRERCPDHWPPAQTRTQRLRLLRTRHGYRLPPYHSAATRMHWRGIGYGLVGSAVLWAAITGLLWWLGRV